MNKKLCDLLHAYHDGELDQRTERRFREHLETCESCRKDLRSLEKLQSLLQAREIPNRKKSHERFDAEIVLQLKNKPTSKAGFNRKNWFLLVFPVSLGLVYMLYRALQLLIGVLSAAGMLGYNVLPDFAPHSLETFFLNGYQFSIDPFDGISDFTLLLWDLISSMSLFSVLQIILPGILGLAFLGWFTLWINQENREKKSMNGVQKE